MSGGLWIYRRTFCSTIRVVPLPCYTVALRQVKRMMSKQTYNRYLTIYTNTFENVYIHLKMCIFSKFYGRICDCSDSVWLFWQYVVVLTVCGSSGNMWLFWQYVAVLTVCGCSGNMWLFHLLLLSIILDN